MGWQDRDYARVTPRYGAGAALRRGGWPWGIVTTLIGVNVAIFLLENLFGLEEWISGTQTFSPLHGITHHLGIAELQARAVLHGQIWRLLTAQYLHAGVGHLFMNMLVLHFLGRSLERMWSARRFFAVYTICGLAGNTFYTVLAAQGVIPMWLPAVGASGCIYGLLGIVAVLFPQATVYIYFLFPLKIRTAAMLFGGISLFTVISRGGNFGGEACHLAGLVFGVWWAMKGDAWWASTGWRFPPLRFPRWRSVGGGSRSTVGRVAHPKGFGRRVASRRADAATIDRILRKVYDGGVHTLSEAEKRSLQDATQRQQERERSADHNDHL